MTIEEIRVRVEGIRKSTYDDEACHSSEDALWRDVLEAIASGASNAQELAAEAIKTQEIDFARWCA